MRGIETGERGPSTGNGSRPGTESAASAAITAEIVRNALAVAVEEASIVVVRSSHSSNIQEGADAAGALLDAGGRLVAQSAATSVMHSASLRSGLRSILEEISLEELRPGDVLACNDPYRGGIHANDIMVLRPVFADGRVRWFGGTLIHVADMGGSAVGGLGSLAGDTYAEGVLLPPVWLYREGTPNRDVLGIIERNSRAPSKVIGDVQALVAGVNVVARRMDELTARYGIDELERQVDHFIEYAALRFREEIRRIPAGCYRGSFTIDSDGVSPGRTFEVVTAVTVADDTITVDFTGTAAQSAGSINSSVSQTLSGVLYAIRCFVDPSIPMNEGCFEAIRTVLPPGSLVNPNPPAACGGRVVTVTAGVEAILQALSQAVPDRAVAASALIHVYTLTGLHPDGERWLTLGYEFGGIGARHGADGPDATGSYFLGGRSVIPQIEPLEAQLPFVVERCALVADSGGAGQWRGGLGVEMRIRLESPAQLTVRGDRMGMPPPGAHGGRPGGAGHFAIERDGGVIEWLNPKQQHVPLEAGDVFVMRTSGGGGLGLPADRHPEAVAEDVAEGRVTPSGAREYAAEPGATV
ncbi:MAG TPA: hydantoinase B/oxoprolinase family protein [Acidimicrobiales bacterium]|nr:hydantoinase B/oxoprolinase family protein [Acidimicrobiales bacterium]